VRISKFEEIEAWKATRQLTSNVYRATTSTAFNQDLALLRQMRSAAVSTMANIAEGFDSASSAEFARFLKISRRSATEVQSHLYVCVDRGYLSKPIFEGLYADCNRVKELLGGFFRYLSGARKGANVERRT
jgi:four helix bundle protein